MAQYFVSQIDKLENLYSCALNMFRDNTGNTPQVTNNGNIIMNEALPFT